MKCQILTVLLVLAVFLPCYNSKPGHLVHDFYKCTSEYYKMNYKHCREQGLVDMRETRQTRQLYSAAPPTASNILLTGLLVVLHRLASY